jgi:hypothetical protein
MAVPQEQSYGQNSAYRSGCLNYFILLLTVAKHTNRASFIVPVAHKNAPSQSHEVRPNGAPSESQLVSLNCGDEIGRERGRVGCA